MSCSKISNKTFKQNSNTIFLFVEQMQTFKDECRSITEMNFFWVAQNNKLAIDAINKLNKCRRANLQSSARTLLIEVLNSVNDDETNYCSICPEE